MKWQVLYLRPRLEKKTAELCRTSGIPCYLPVRSQTRTYQRRKVTTETPVFPGYLFVALDASRRLPTHFPPIPAAKITFGRLASSGTTR